MKRSASLGGLWLTLFLDLVGFSIVFPVYAEMIHAYRAQGGLIDALCRYAESNLPPMGSAETLVGGLFFALFAALQFVGSPLWGALSDRVGRRPVLLFTIAGNALAYGLWAISGADWLLILSRMLSGFMAGNLAVATAAMADLTPDHQRTKGMALVGIAFGLGFLCGPALGAAAYTWLPRVEAPLMHTLQLHAFSGVALLAFGLSVMNLLWIALRLGESLPSEQRSSSRKLHWDPFYGLSKRAGSAQRRVNLCYGMYIVLFAGMEAVLVFLAKEHLGYTPGQMGVLFLIIGTTSALVQGGVVRRLAPRLGDRRLARLGFAVQTPGYVLLGMVALMPVSWLLTLSATLLSIGTALAMPSLAALISRNAGADTQGKAMGGFRAVGSLGRMLGPALGGAGYFVLGPSMPFWIAAVCTLVPIVGMAAVPEPSREG